MSDIYCKKGREGGRKGGREGGRELGREEGREGVSETQQTRTMEKPSHPKAGNRGRERDGLHCGLITPLFSTQ